MPFKSSGLRISRFELLISRAPFSPQASEGKTGRSPKMVLMEFRNRGGDFLNVEAPIILYEEDGIYTQEVLRAYEGEKL